MRSNGLLIVVLVAALGISGCGGGSKRKKSTPGGGTTTTTTGPAHDATFHVDLTGGKSGAPGASAKAVIQLHVQRGQTCWTFTDIKGVDKPKFAYVWRGTADQRGVVVFPLSTTPKLAVTGCGAAPLKYITAIEHNPSGFYATISNKKYPTEAVRGQL